MTIYKNGIVFTANNNISESFSVKDGKFTFVGTNSEIEKFAEFGEEIIDLQGRTVLPGFNDSHLHFLNYAVNKDRIKLSTITSINEMIKVSKNYIEKNKISKGNWIISRGWNDNLFDEKRFPNRFDLDKISEEHPIFFTRACNHIGVANSRALEFLNIYKGTPNPEGGIIDKDAKSGLPNGVLRENALNIVFNTLPQNSKEEIKRVLSNAFEDALKVGLTSIQTDDIGEAGNIETLIEAYRELQKEGKLPLRVTLQLLLPDKESICRARDLGLTSGIGSSFLRIGPMKLLQDGSLGGRTAAMQEPYCDTNSKGVYIYSQEKLNELTHFADSLGFQIAVHAIGDEAVNMVLKSLEGISKRPAIIHCQFTNDDLLKRFKTQKVIANIQPAFVMTDWPIVDSAIGEKRSEASYAWKDMLKLNIPVSFSSDAPIESFNPMFAIYAAVTRKNLNEMPEDGWHSKQCISLSEAITAYTLGSAYMSFEENIKGSIDIGKVADFVILSENIFDIDPKKIKNIKIKATYINGNKVYSSI